MSLYQLDTENADRNLTSSVTVLTHTPTVAALCIGLIKLGDGSKNLDGTGGNFELVITVGGQTVQASPQVIVFSTAVRSAIWTDVFPVPASHEVILKVKSPNAADTDVDVTAYLYDSTFALPGAASDAAGGLPISDAGGLDVDAILADTNELQTDLVNGGRLDLLIDAIKAKTDNLPSSVPKGVALTAFSFPMYSNKDHVTPITGMSVTCYISKNGGAFAEATNPVYEISNGWYYVTITATEMNADVIGLRAVATGADDLNITIKTDS